MNIREARQARINRSPSLTAFYPIADSELQVGDVVQIKYGIPGSKMSGYDYTGIITKVHPDKPGVFFVEWHKWNDEFAAKDNESLWAWEFNLHKNVRVLNEPVPGQWWPKDRSLKSGSSVSSISSSETDHKENQKMPAKSNSNKSSSSNKIASVDGNEPNAVTTVLLRDLTRDLKFETRAGVHVDAHGEWIYPPELEATIVDYQKAMKEGKKFPPIDAYSLKGFDKYPITDGHLRYEAMRRNGEVRCLVHIIVGTYAEAWTAATKANVQFDVVGLKRTNADKHRAALSILQIVDVDGKPVWSGRSNNVIAAEIGVGSDLIANCRKELKAEAKAAGKPDPTPETRTDAKGRNMNTTNVGRTQNPAAKARREIKAVLRNVAPAVAAVAQTLIEREEFRSQLDATKSVAETAVEIAQEITSTGGNVSYLNDAGEVETKTASTVLVPSTADNIGETAADRAFIQKTEEKGKAHNQHKFDGAVNGKTDRQNGNVTISVKGMKNNKGGWAFKDGKGMVEAISAADAAILNDVAKYLDMGYTMALVLTKPVTVGDVHTPQPIKPVTRVSSRTDTNGAKLGGEDETPNKVSNAVETSNGKGGATNETTPSDTNTQPPAKTRRVGRPTVGDAAAKKAAAAAAANTSEVPAAAPEPEPAKPKTRRSRTQTPAPEAQKPEPQYAPVDDIPF